MPGSNTATHQNAYQTPNAQVQVSVAVKDLPLHCPQPGTSLWNSHPRVFLPIEGAPDGHIVCPYCGTQYVLQEHPSRY